MVDYSDRKGDWMQTFSGRRFYPADPRTEDVSIDGIAHALSHMNRFNGHTRWPYSVAAHSVFAWEFAPTGFKLEALLHDASEAYICDLARPIKRMLVDYQHMEKQVDAIIRSKFGLPAKMSVVVKYIDWRLLVTEADQLMGDGAEKWWVKEGYPPPFYVTLTHEPPHVVKAKFLRAFHGTDADT